MNKRKVAKRKEVPAIQKVGLFVLKREKNKLGKCPCCEGELAVDLWCGGAGRGGTKMLMVQRPNGQVALTLQDKKAGRHGPGSGYRRSVELARRSLIAELKKSRMAVMRELKRDELLIRLVDSAPRKSVR